MTAKKIVANEIKTRDHLLVRLINGATKSGAHKNHKKVANCRHCRSYNWKREE